MTEQQEEPWLRGCRFEVEPGDAGQVTRALVMRALIHSIEMAREDIARWCGDLDDAEIHARPFELPSVGFQLRHIAGSLDRLLTYAEGRALSEEQMAALAGEKNSQGTTEAVFAEFAQGLEGAGRHLEAIAALRLDAPVEIGRRALATTVAGVLVHAAEHTQRHVGQAITTAKVVIARRRADAR